MIGSRKLRLLIGLAASIIGLLVIAIALFGLFQEGIQAITIYFLSALSLVLLSIGALAVLYNRSGSALWRRCLWVSTGLLIIGAFFSLASIGIFFVPSILLAILASASTRGNHSMVAG